MQITSVSSNVNFLRQKPGPGTAASGEDMQKILDDFVKEACKTPEQRMKEAILKKHHLTEEDYDKLPKQLHDAIAKEIADAVQQVTRRRVHQPDGPASPVAPQAGLASGFSLSA